MERFNFAQGWAPQTSDAPVKPLSVINTGLMVAALLACCSGPMMLHPAYAGDTPPKSSPLSNVETVKSIYIEPIPNPTHYSEEFAHWLKNYLEAYGYQVASSVQDADAIMTSEFSLDQVLNSPGLKITSPVQFDDPPVGSNQTLLNLKLVSKDNETLWLYQSADTMPKRSAKRAIQHLKQQRETYFQRFSPQDLKINLF